MEKIRVKNLSKIFGANPKKALDLLQKGLSKEEVLEKTGMTVGVQDASFSVEEGEIFVVMGLSGSGKSTLVRLLNRLIEPSAGRVLLDGEDVAQMPKEKLLEVRRKKMCMVFQSFALMPHMTVVDNVAFGLELSGMEKNARHERAKFCLEQVGLAPWADSYPKELSGGMQQRVGLARGLAVNPDILLMDEAFSALDPLIRCEMQDELLKLQQKDRRTIIFISHDLDEAMRIGDRIAIMEGGRVVQVGTPEEILQNPADDYVRAFFRGVDPTNILSAGDICRDTQLTYIRHRGEGPRALLERLNRQDREYATILDAEHKLLGIASVDSLRAVIEAAGEGKPSLESAYVSQIEPVATDDSMQDILPLVASNAWPVPVVDEGGIYKGVISKNTFLRTLYRTEEHDADMPQLDEGGTL
jgi:glycine betaine/proline transport system ATP-binding protein